MSDDFKNAPPWFQSALKEVGVHEKGENRGSDIRRYIALAHAGQEGDPWCAIFTNAMLEANKVSGTHSAGSQSFKNDKRFVKLASAALGAIVVFWRGSKGSGLGHVGFYRGENDTHIWVLGGNEGDMVQIEALPKSSAAFGLVGYYWPAGVPLPKLAPIKMAGNAPTHQTKVT